MKKILVSLLVVFTLVGTTTITGCKKDKEASKQEQIVGNWNMDKAYSVMSFGGSSQKDTTEFEDGEYVNFKADGTLTSNDGGGTWEISGSKLKITNPDEDGPQEFDIKKLDGTELQLYSKQTEGESFFESTLFLKR